MLGCGLALGENIRTWSIYFRLLGLRYRQNADCLERGSRMTAIDSPLSTVPASEALNSFVKLPPGGGLAAYSL